VNALQAARERKLAAAARGSGTARGERIGGPPRCGIERAQAALAAVREAAAGARAARRTNITDPDSRIMSTARGWVQGDKPPAIVNQDRIVLSCEVSQDATDARLYLPMTGTP
jgi:hypothetical protein